jgi:predicted RNA binding protein YcfA (HicA-like mRNA interferase family)
MSPELKVKIVESIIEPSEYVQVYIKGPHVPFDSVKTGIVIVAVGLATM